MRIFCKNNYRKRIETKESLQYTITILPGFLMPYSRVRIDLLFTAFTYYLSGKIRNQYEAALFICCDSRHSFALYYKRIMNHVGYLYEYFKVQIETKRNEVSLKTSREKWESIVCLMKETVVAKTSWQVYLNAMIFGNRMGLGP